LLLTVFSSFGQTFFISLFGSEIRSNFSLTHGQFGGVYMIGTLASAVTLIWLGRVVDTYSVSSVAVVVCGVLALACLAMSQVSSVIMLILVIYALRLFGQGMMTHTAMTAMGRWYSAERGRAVALTSAGHQLGEAVLPIIVVLPLGWLGWRETWLVAALLLLVVAMPALYLLMRNDRIPNSSPAVTSGVKETVRQWTRREVMHDPMFWLICMVVLIPSFIGTSIFFHQVHLGEIKGWSRERIAGSFAVMSVTTVCFSFLAGTLVDRYSARRLLPVFLLPLGLGCLYLGWSSKPGTILLFMSLLGISYGFSTVIFGSLWPEIYGTRHLGAIRSLTMAAMVLASAVGPGVTGELIDRGAGFDSQLIVMGCYCLVVACALVPLSNHLIRRTG